MKKSFFKNATLLLLGILASGCTSNIIPLQLTDMEAFALCRDTEQGKNTEKAIKAEYGFKRFNDNTYSPVVDKTLVGHKIRMVIINDKFNILYVTGEPSQFAHHFQYLLKEIQCENEMCQAPINKAQTLKFYKAKIKKSKYTTVMECNKLPPKDAEQESETSNEGGTDIKDVVNQPTDT